MATDTDKNEEGLESMDTDSPDAITDDQTIETPYIAMDTSSTIDEENGSNGVPVTQQLVLLVAIIFLLLGGSLSPRIIAFFKDTANITPAAPVQAETPQLNLETKEETPTIKPFSTVQIKGEAAYVWDVQAQRALYKKSSSESLPLASVTKLMTALVAHEILTENSDIHIGAQAIRQDGDSGLLSGETFNRQTLSDLVLMSSSNDGAYAMAVAAGGVLEADDPADAFVHAMNIRAEELALHDTYFKNPTGLDISQTEGGGYGSARDISFLMEYIILHQPDILTFTQEDSARVYSRDGIYHDAVNTNYYIDEIPGLIGSKTGYTDLAGGNLVVAFDAGLNRPIIVAVLGSTRHERFTDVITLVEEAQKYVVQN